MSFRYITLLLGIFLLSFSAAEAQKFRKFKNTYNKRMYRHGQLSYIGGAAISTYYGDLKDNPVNLWAKPSTQLGVQYRYNNHLHFRSEVLWYRISGADTLNDPEQTTIYDRNLSFRADNFEMNVVGLWTFFNKYARYNRPTLNPYVFAGVGFTTNNPKAKYQGDWYSLRPLQTEGVEYSGIVFVIPAGLGVTYHINNSWDVSLEYGYRVTFNDYLDDASTDYRDPDTFTDPIARELADRRDELPFTARYTGDKYRGNPSRDDWYLITGLKVTYSPGPANQQRYKRPKSRGRR